MSTWVRTFENIRLADQACLRTLGRFRGPLLDTIMRALTKAGDWQSWTLLMASALIAGGAYRSIAFAVAPRLAGTFALCFVLKKISRRQRPGKALSDFSSLLKDPDPYSFPSSHSACAWAASLSIGVEVGAGWPFWAIYPAMIAYSRVHVGAHYPLDVVIGSLIGAAFAFY